MLSTIFVMATLIYTPLDSSNLDVRFLKLSPAANFSAPIHCTVYKASVMDEDGYPGYNALSYCWGPDHPTGEIFLNSKKFVVRQNLESALRQLRHQVDETTLWVDALCINQDDISERSSQVNEILDAMYSDADEVIVWLGTETEDSCLAFDLIEQWARWSEHKLKLDGPFKVEQDIPHAFASSSIKALDQLLQRDYWGRVWVVQEVALAQDIVVVCGRLRLSFECFEWAKHAWTRLVHAYEDLPSPTHFDKYLAIKSLHTLNLEQMMSYRDYRIRACANWDMPPLPFFDLLASCRHLKCKDPRDRIYALLNLGGPHTKNFKLLATPDYTKSVESVYREVARNLIEEDRSLRVVAFACNLILSSNVPSLPELPSWAPDWTCASMLGPMYLRLHTKFMAMIEKSYLTDGTDQKFRFSRDSRSLFSQGIAYDKVGRLYPQWLPDLKGNKDEILHALLGTSQPDGIPNLQALFRVLSLNMRWPGSDEPDALRRPFLNKVGWYIWQLWPRDEPQCSRVKQMLMELFADDNPGLLLELTELIHSGFRWKDPDVAADVSEFWSKATEISKSRVLFVTETGRMGLGPPGITVKDEVCILRGYPGPFVLRQLGNWYVPCGECCIGGLRAEDCLAILDSTSLDEFEIR